MLFYTHPIDDERTQQGLPRINGFWVSGAGLLPARNAPLPAVELHTTLRGPALNSDWAEWLQVWQQIDAEVLAPLVAQAQAGQAVRVTLCGEKSWQHFEYNPGATHHRTWWQRTLQGWQRPRNVAVADVLGKL
jgi:hypothetical protein